MPLKAPGLDTPMIVVRTGDGLAALLVDEVEDVVALPDGSLQPPAGTDAARGRLLAVCQVDTDLVFLLDPARLTAPAAKTGRGGRKAGTR
jgi:chemotaxis signal transduction protein